MLILMPPPNSLLPQTKVQEDDPNAPALKLASPGGRWLASVLDGLFLLLLHVLALTPFVATNRLDAAFLNQFALLSPWFCWVYLCFGWWRGATPGKWLCGLRVVREDGEKLSARDALWRCLCAMLAMLPLKAGLLPILWDERRQGWHDRLAHTLVVHVTNGQTKISHWPWKKQNVVLSVDASNKQTNILRSPLNSRRLGANQLSAERLLRKPDIAFAWQGCGWVLGIYFLLALAMTWPLATQWRTALAGGEGDALLFAWNYWWFEHALSTGQSVLETSLVFHPQRVSLAFHTMQLFNCVLALPLQRCFGLVGACNLLLWLTMALNAWSAYLLCCALTRDRLCSLIGALAFGFSPFFTARALGHANLLAAQFLPLLALFFYAALYHQKARFALVAGLMLALNAFCDWQHFLAGIALIIALQTGTTAALWLEMSREKAAGAKWMKSWMTSVWLMGLTLITGAILVSPLLYLLMQQRQQVLVTMPIGGELTADPIDFLAFTPFHAFLPRWIDVEKKSIEWIITPGVIVMCLASVSLLRCKERRTWYPWVCVIVTGLMLCLGPVLTLAGHQQFPRWVLLLGGAPGNGLDVPWRTGFFEWALGIWGNPELFTKATHKMILPLARLLETVEVLKAWRVPARLCVLVTLALCVMASATLANWRGRRRNSLRFQEKRHGWLCSIGLTLMGLLILGEYWVRPLPLFALSGTRFYSRIARDTDAYALVDVPLSPGYPDTARYQFAQSFHHKPIVSGYLSRPPGNGWEFLDTNAILKALETSWEKPGVLPAVHLTPQVEQESARRLKSINVRYILLHTDRLTPESLSRAQTLMRRIKFRLVWHENELLVYRARDEGPLKYN